MAHHWPLGIAAGLIALAASLGFWQHNRAAIAASTALAPFTRPTSAAPANPGAANKAAPVTPAAPATNATPAPVTAPAATGDTKTQPVAPLVPALGANPVAAPAVPAAPAAVPAAPAIQPVAPGARAQVLAELRAALQGKLGVMPADSAVGGYAVSVDGARVDVQPLPNWSVRVVNNNAKVPEQETENFKVCLQVVASMLGINLNQKAVEAANGKTYLTTTSKMGSVSVIRDPAVGNSCTIAPLQRVVPVPAAPAVNQNQPPVQPNPKQPQPAPGPPVTPPRPRDAEPVF